jgi:hypothetical protein
VWRKMYSSSRRIKISPRRPHSEVEYWLISLLSCFLGKALLCPLQSVQLYTVILLLNLCLSQGFPRRLECKVVAVESTTGYVSALTLSSLQSHKTKFSTSYFISCKLKQHIFAYFISTFFCAVTLFSVYDYCVTYANQLFTKTFPFSSGALVDHVSQAPL